MRLIPLSRRAKRKRTPFDKVPFLRKVDVGIYVDESCVKPFYFDIAKLFKAMYSADRLKEHLYAPSPLLQMIPRTETEGQPMTLRIPHGY